VHVIEEETRTFLGEAVERAKVLIGERRAELDRMVDALLEDETLDRDRIVALFDPPTGTA
jgi:ATP-dependent Zn protease